ncbi:LysR family substrate-binding domain-containing protein [Catenulispora sp. NF23]|uniref:LysR family substrate-binding domain-containing protein n=1 Tax=Catenulispora pinistramenti TaxID=2705254 RepID=UPI001BA80F3B|nr:LysR family substrate-binding domain-containing protein [Catenulispora pinistramenti]MBS2539089.1 LysR family substrate-binding domain-containing protein [Catenulispora pinistramenti]
MTGTQSSPAPTFRLAYVPGATPAKWVRTWAERLPEVPLELVAVPVAAAHETLTGGEADAGLVRLPVDRDVLNAIPLYAETTVVVVPKDHEVTAAEEVSVGELGEYIVLHPLDDCLEWDSLPGQPAVSRPETTADAIELVAAGIGVLLVPQSLARLHHRKDLTYRTVTDAPQSQIALSWAGETSDLVEEFIGIVRGRTVNSSRGRAAQAAGGEAKPKRTAEAGKAGGASSKNKSGGGSKSGSGSSGSGSSGAKARSGGTGKAASGRRQTPKPRRRK